MYVFKLVRLPFGGQTRLFLCFLIIAYLYKGTRLSILGNNYYNTLVCLCCSHRTFLMYVHVPLSLGACLANTSNGQIHYPAKEQMMAPSSCACEVHTCVLGCTEGSLKLNL